jgi:hypothetical protein
MVHVWTTAQPRCLLLLGEPVQDRAHNVARKFPDRTDAVEPLWPLGFLLPALIGRILAAAVVQPPGPGGLPTGSAETP